MLQHVKDYFHFTASGLRAVLVLLAAIFILILGIPLVPLMVNEDHAKHDRLVRMVDSLFAAGHFRQDSLYGDTSSATSIDAVICFESDPFYFDPNELDKEGWLRTGLEEKIIRTILNYREKGGVFRKPGDLNRIYGMNEADAERLEPFMVYPSFESPGKTAHFKEKPMIVNPGGHSGTPLIVELNSADTSLLMQCRGIGRYYAGKIIKYRDMLGGFYSKEQLLEVRGMDSARYHLFEGQVSADPSAIKKLDLNSVSFKELLKHPYFEYHLVKAVFELKDRRGRIDSLGRLNEIPFMYDELYRKILPYLSTGVQAEK